jgi:hypothetical protein
VPISGRYENGKGNTNAGNKTVPVTSGQSLHVLALCFLPTEVRNFGCGYFRKSRGSLTVCGCYFSARACELETQVCNLHTSVIIQQLNLYIEVTTYRVFSLGFISWRLMSYVFIGVGFPMHRDLIWSIVRPL